MDGNTTQSGNAMEIELLAWNGTDSNPNAIRGCFVDAIPGVGDTIFPKNTHLPARHGTIHFAAHTGGLGETAHENSPEQPLEIQFNWI